MASVEEVRSLVEQEVARLLGVPEATKTDRGDIVAESGSSVTYIRVMDDATGTMVRFLSPIVRGVTRSMDLLEALNDLNARTHYVRFFWKRDQVFCSIELAGDDLQWHEIGNALTAITAHADDVDDLLAGRFGGSTMGAPS